MDRKKILAVLLCAAMLVSLLSACGGGSKPSGTDGAVDSQAGETVDGQDTSPEDAQSPEAGSGTDALTGIAMGNGSGFIMDLPQGYQYDSAWSCYSSDSTGVKIWVPDANFYETENEFSSALENYGDDLKEQELDGILFAWKHEDPAGFYGAETHYCISLSEYYQGKSGCHLMVSSESGDLAATQAPEIIDALKTIRMEGEAAGERAEAVAMMNADPYESLVINFTAADTAAMSTFMSGGFYGVDGDTVFGEGFASDGTAELVRIDLVPNGSFADVDKYTVLEKGVVPTYVTVYGDDVYYIHGGDGSGLYKVSRNGGTPQLIIEDAAAYLQIRGDKLYYCDSGYTFRQAELDGSNSVPVLDKEVYYPYFVNDQWFIYQDDADDESLHLRHALKGEDITLCPIPSYSPVICGTDLYLVASSNGEKTLAKIDMAYEPESMDNFGIEYGDRNEAADITISAEGYLFYGLNSGLSIDRWREAENPDETYAMFYRYLGETYEIYWEFDGQGRVSAVYVTLLSGGGSQSLPRFD